MQYMKYLIIYMISFFLPFFANGQNLPHTFNDGDVIYADQINENFKIKCYCITNQYAILSNILKQLF